jgi:hypothetical protein
MRRPSLPPLLLGAFGSVFLLSGCAREPSGSSTAVLGRQVVISMTVRGNIDLADDYYFVCFNVNNTSENGFTGPVPVVTDFQSGGNGFAGGAFSSFVEIHQGQPQSNFGIYSVSSNLLTPSYLGQPINGNISNGTLTFEIPLSDIASASGIAESSISSVEVNFITTNDVSTNPNDTTIKYFDALGNPELGQLNDFVTIPTAQDTTYSDSTFNDEGSDDVAAFSTSASSTNPSQTNFSSTVQVLPDQTPTTVANVDITGWTVTFNG